MITPLSKKQEERWKSMIGVARMAERKSPQEHTILAVNKTLESLIEDREHRKSMADYRANLIKK